MNQFLLLPAYYLKTNSVIRHFSVIFPGVIVVETKKEPGRSLKMPPALYGLFSVYVTLVVLGTHAITIEELPPGMFSIFFRL
ncbi:unnamed protein product [Macrosiphum euphorbiae]|uniref:Uncharacterized protein n=1 Tax=Macrosiphum euphorbiae TaxID=13131 RepID=A0AAV0XI96_9HEMI|nr:unnamed protein product [Macrosiphum euphorbiae]